MPPPAPPDACFRARARRGFGGNREKKARGTMTDSAKTVLLVEDNEDNRTVYRTILEHFGYGVIEARNGEDGIRMARELHPDLILMDISIPVIDGWEATRVLKGEEATAGIP